MSRGSKHQPLDRVPQLANIAWQRMAQEGIKRRRRQDFLLSGPLAGASRKLPISNGMSARRSRSGGTRMTITLSR